MRRLLVLLLAALLAAPVTVALPGGILSPAPALADDGPDDGELFWPISTIRVCGNDFYATGADCIASSYSTVMVDAGDPIRLTSPLGVPDLGHANVCGDLACTYNSFVWHVQNGWGLTADPDGTCASYGGFGGGPTREVTDSPQSCDLLATAPLVTAPAYWMIVNVTVGSGSFISAAHTFLIGIRPELFKVDVSLPDTSAAPVSYALRPGANPRLEDCAPVDIPAWLADHVPPDCISFYPGTSSFPGGGMAPNGSWDIVAYDVGLQPTDRLRDKPSSYRAVVAQVANRRTPVTLVPKSRPTVTGTLTLSGGDDVLGVDEDAVATATLRIGTDGEPGDSYVVSVYQPVSGRILYSLGGTPSTISVWGPTPAVEAAGYTLPAGGSLTFQVPVRGVAAGTVTLGFTAYVRPAWSPYSSINTGQLALQITTTPPPPPPPGDAQACGHDVLTRLASPSLAGATSVTVDPPALAAGARVVVDPCTASSEEATVQSVSGSAVTFTSPLTRAHAADSPIVAAAPAQDQQPTPRATTVHASKPKPVKKGKRAKVTVTVGSETTVTETTVTGGTVTVRNGRKTVGTGTVVNGTVTIRLKRLAPGRHRLTIAYAGNGSYLPSTGGVVVKVKKKR